MILHENWKSMNYFMKYHESIRAVSRNPCYTSFPYYSICNGVDDRSSVVVLSFHRKLHGVHIQYYIAFLLSIKYNLLVFVKKFNLKMYVLFS